MLTLVLMAGCGGAQEASPGDFWGRQSNVQGTGRSPDPPAKLADWVADGAAEQYRARAFDSSWEPATGPKGGFPAGGNSCSGQHLIKWRSEEPGITVRASWQYPPDQMSEDPPPNMPAGKPVTADRGWMILDSCQEPVFRFARADDANVNLVDVVVTARRYSATP